MAAEVPLLYSPLEAMVVGHALKKMLSEYGDDAVLSAALEKTDKALQATQAATPGLAEELSTHVELMQRKPKPTRRGLARPAARPVREDPNDLGYELGN